MKKFIVIILILAIVIGVIVGRAIFVKNSPPVVNPGGQSLGTLIVATPTVGTQTITPDIPVRLSIPELGINTAVEQVGMDAQGRMDVPSNNVNVAWYNLGYRPGAEGNAVIDGHLDTVTGAPAVFYYLSNLHPGDEIIVTDASSHTFHFKVTDIENYPYDQFPLQEVFGAYNKPRLNLITCEGTFNNATHNYSHRTVVYSVLADVR